MVVPFGPATLIVPSFVASTPDPAVTAPDDGAVSGGQAVWHAPVQALLPGTASSALSSYSDMPVLVASTVPYGVVSVFTVTEVCASA